MVLADKLGAVEEVETDMVMVNEGRVLIVAKLERNQLQLLD